MTIRRSLVGVLVAMLVCAAGTLMRADDTKEQSEKKSGSVVGVLIARRIIMRWWIPWSLLGLGVLAADGVAAGQPPAQAVQQAGWFTDYQAARAAARSSGKPLFVVFRCQP